jgi:hypothetical protein
MNDEDRLIRTGFGVLTESAPPAPSFEEITAQTNRSPIWRPTYAVVALGLALMVFVATVVFNGGMRLAYAMDPGLDMTYTVDSESAVAGETFSNGPASVRYQIGDAGDGLVDVHISYEPLDGCDGECFPSVTFSQTVTEQGEIVSIEGLTDGQEIPEFVIPVPIPHAGITAGFPLFLGPPLPGRDLALGDIWETNEEGVAGRHQLVDQTQLDGRDVVTIDSTYSYTQPELGEEITATTRVWFDPAEGVVVQAQIIRNQAWLDKTVEMEFQLRK